MKNHPKLNELDGSYYTQEESKIVKYADERDLSCSEIDVPGHASALLLTAYPERGVS
jgi:N-acetyl-beta-hexosaminidase